jgi:hypothetical protein
MKKGCTIWMFKPGFHHTKVIMVDGKFCTVGLGQPQRPQPVVGL